MFDTQFSGRIIQVAEALSYGDAVSNQIMALDNIFRASGLASHIATMWHDPRVADRRQDLDSLVFTEKDILIHHYYGFSEHSINKVLNSNSTKIMCYHNITPSVFFSESSPTFQFCAKGRVQLKEIIEHFHYFWGDSQYNNDEIVSLGADPDRCTVIPIIIPQPGPEPQSATRKPGAWLFVSRIAPNKCQADLIRLFAGARAANQASASHLYLVGGFDEAEPYFSEVEAAITSSGLIGHVTLTGKVSDEEREAYFRRASVYVSMSRHEGFGVPLIEASLRGLPVLALDGTAIGETMGHGPGLAKNEDELLRLVSRAQEDTAWRTDLIAAQSANARRFAPQVVEKAVHNALRRVLPRANQFRTVSVVICTYNRREYLARVLDYLRYQTCPQFEVVIVDGPSSDGTKDFLEKYQGRAKIAHNPHRNLSISRNIGIEMAAGDIVAFIDDDAIPFDDWVQTLIDEYNARPLTTAGLGGPVYYAGTLKFQMTDIGFNNLAEAMPHIDSNQIGKNGVYRSQLGTNSSFSRHHLIDIDGFDEQYDYFLDESDVCYRLQLKKYLIGYCSELYLRHEFAQSANRLSKYEYNWFSICKNTAYFIAAYSGLNGGDLRIYLEARLRQERIAPLDAAVAAGELAEADRDRHVAEIWRGLEQGLTDVRQFPRTRPLAQNPPTFLGFGASAARLRVGSELPSLHICIISKEFPPFAARGGIGTLYYHLASELLLLGHRVSVIVPGEEPGEFQQGRFRVISAPMHQAPIAGLAAGFARNINCSAGALSALADLHSREKVDIVESALWDTEALTTAMLPRGQRPPVVLRLVTPFPVAARINDWSVPEPVAAYYSGAERALIEAANAVVPISDSIADTIASAYGLLPDSRWHRIHCGICYWPSFDVNQGYAAFHDFERVPAKALESNRLVVFLGRLEHRKGIDMVLEAANHFLAGMSDAHLIVAGRDIEGWAERSASLLKPSARNRTFFLGEIPDSTREKLLARACVLLFPSRYESFGLVPLEAFVHGVPVVAAGAGAIPEVVINGECGFLFPANDAEAMADCVRQILMNSELRQRLSDGARQRVRKLSSRKMALESVELYRRLL
jgi:glycosyltransferase involved in cell wall biosynthesis